MILNKGTRLSQPQGPVELDYANSLAKGMAWLYLPSVEKELVRSLPITKGGGYTRGPVAGGVGQVLDANSSITTPSASLNSSDTLTMFSVASVKATLVSQAAIVSHAGTGSGSAGSTVVGQTGYAGGGGAGAVVYYSPNYNGYITASSPGGDFIPGNVVVIVATYRRNDALCVYANGNLRATTAAADYQANLKFNSTVNVGGPSASSTNVLMSGISYRAWSDAEIVEFSANPWQLFKPAQRRIYFDMGAGGGASPVSSDQSSSYAIRGSVSSDHAASYAIRSSVNADLSASYNIQTASAVSSDLPSGYEIRTSAQSDVSAEYIIRASVQANSSAAYAIRSSVQADAGAAFFVRGAVLSDAAASYVVRTNAIADLSAAYEIQTASGVGASLDASYNVRAAVQSDASAAYDLRTAVGATSEHAFMVRGLVSSDLDASYTVDASLVPVYADMQAAYLVDGGAVFIPSQFVASVPAGVFSARAPAGEYSATVPAGNYRASI